jgi:subtilisin family serine protease
MGLECGKDGSWWRRPVAVVVVTVLTVAGGAVAGVLAGLAAGPVPASATPPEGLTAEQLNGMFREYGDQGVGWTGGDSTVSIPLPDGRVAWLFADTFLGAVNPDGSRPANTPMVNNTLVVQEGTQLVETRFEGTAGFPQALVTPEQPGEFFWVADGLVESGQLRVLYNRYTRFGTGSLDVEPTGTSLATFSLPDLALVSVTDLPVGTAISWGAALLADGPYTYVYGTSAGLGGLKFAHLARAQAGSLGGAWQFWTGSDWSTVEDEAARLLSGVGAAFAVERVGGEIVLVTQEGNQVFDPQLVAYTAAAPAGPFTGPTYLLTAPEQQPGEDVIVYTARLHQGLASPGKLLLSYDVNSLDNDDVFADARLYRPRFVELDWPRPQPGPVPGAPAGLQAIPDPSGVVGLSWAAVDATGYYVYQRDVTGGQTHFYRRVSPVSEPGVEVDGLITGHRYEFRVTAANDAGESAVSATVAATARIVRDASIIRFANTPDAITGSYLVRFEDTPAVRSRGVEALARELLAQAGGGTLDRLFPLTLRGFAATLTEVQAIDIAGHPDVIDVEQDQVITLDGEQTDPLNWGIDRIDQRHRPLDQRYRYPYAAGSVDAYVIDSGIRWTHDTFGGRVTFGINTVDGNMNADDCRGHGTHVAGILGGAEYGVAKDVHLIAIKVFPCSGPGRNRNVAEGVEWATSEALKPENRDTQAVINMSLGHAASDPDTTAIGVAVLAAINAGLTVVASAGNANSDACRRTPAGVTGVITVANSDLDDRRSPRSGWGTCVDLFAPGTEILSAGHNFDDAMVFMSGTSMATPHVAGVAAMVLAAHPGFSPAQVEKVLQDAATAGVMQDRQGSPDRLLFVEQPPTGVPTNLTATATGAGTIDLSWDAVSGDVHYLVSQRDVTAGESDFTRWPDPVFSGTTANATGLVSGHTYEFTVAASTSTGVGAASNVARATARIDPPGAPTGLSGAPNSDGTITLTWTAPAPDVWYWVYQRDLTAGETDFTRLPLPLTSCCTMTAGLLSHEHEYEFQVSAVNQGGEGAASNRARALARHPATRPPAGLTATAGDGQVTLTWEASPTPNVWYWVYQRDVTAEETDFTRLPLPLTRCCTMTAGFLANGHQYEFKVTATGPAGDSGDSNLARATPLPPKPAQVTGLAAATRPDGTIRLTWNPLNSVYYWIYQRDVTAGEGFTRLSLPTDQTSFTAGLLTHNHVYEFRVSAENLAGEGPRSEPVRATSRYQRPNPPGNLRGSTSEDGYVDLDWTAPGPGGLYYWVYHRDVTAGQGSFTRSTLPTDRTSTRLGPFVHGHEYEFRVSAESPGGEGDPSASVRVTSRGGLPRPPSALTAQAGNGQVTLRWTASPTANVWYWIEHRAAGGAWQRSEFPLTTCCTFTVSHLLNGTSYEFRLRATNASGDSSASNVASARPMPPLPAPPTNLTAIAGDGRVTLRWTASPSPGVWYWIEHRAAGGAWQRSEFPLTTCCTFTVSYLLNGTSYEIRLRSTNLAGNSAPSNVARARPMPPTPQPPTNLSAQAGNGAVNLRWTASSTSDVWYWLEFRRNGGVWERSRYPVTTCCRFTVTFLTNNVRYEFRLRATNLAGDSAPSNVASATPRQPPGGCHALAGDPGYELYYEEAFIMKTRGWAAVACDGPVSDVVVSVTLYPVPREGRSDPSTSSQRWGPVPTSREAMISVTHNDYARPWFRCLTYVTQAKATWTVDGSPRSAVHYSRTVAVGPDCGSGG